MEVEFLVCRSVSSAAVWTKDPQHNTVDSDGGPPLFSSTLPTVFFGFPISIVGLWGWKGRDRRFRWDITATAT